MHLCGLYEVVVFSGSAEVSPQKRKVFMLAVGHSVNKHLLTT